MMVHFSILPISDNPHMGEPISKAIKIVHDSGLDYRLTPMGTLINGEWEDVIAVIKKCHETLRDDFDRVITSIKIDDNRLKKVSFDDKIQSVEEKSGIQFNK